MLEGGSLRRDFFRFMLPSLAAQWVYALYTMIDGFFVARGVSEMALSAVNIVMPFTIFLFAAAICFSSGASTLIAVCIGRKDLERARQVFTQTMFFVLLLGLLITALALLFPGQLVHFLGGGPETAEDAKVYLTTVAKFSVFFMVSYTFEIILKIDGYPVRATLIVLAGCVLNCVLDYLLVIVWQKGVWGAALATGISQLSVVMLYLLHFLSGRSHMKLVRFTWDAGLLWKTVRIGAAGAVTEMAAGIAAFFYNHFISFWLGEAYIACYTIAGYVGSLAAVSMVGIVQGTQPLLSYYYGKGRPDKYRRLIRYTLIFALAFAGVFSAASFIFAGALSGIYIDADLPLLRRTAVLAIRCFAVSILLCGGNIVAAGTLTALEFPGFAMAIAVGRGFLFPAASLFAVTALLGGEGLWWAAACSEGICLILTGVLWLLARRGRMEKP